MKPRSIHPDALPREQMFGIIVDCMGFTGTRAVAKPGAEPVAVILNIRIGAA